MTQFNNIDTKRPDGCYVKFVRLVTDDDAIGEHSFSDNPNYGLDVYEHNDFHFVGVQAQARCMIVSNGTGTLVELESPGLWCIESDSGEDYFAEVYANELIELKGMLAAFAKPIFEESSAS